MRQPTAGGGWPAIWYTVRQARRAGGVLRMVRALRTRNACKTCALGMGGQRGGMVNEAGRFPEVCKKSVQAMAADMQGAIREGFFEEFGFDRLAGMTPRELEHAGRLTRPLYAGEGESTYRPIAWDEAIALAADRLRSSEPDSTFFYFSGRSSNEAGFLLQLFARLYGTNNVNNCSYFCHQASGVGLSSVTGSGTATLELEDLDRCDLLFLIGGNPASNHPRFMRTLLDLKRRGGRVVVVNPIRELGLVRFKVPSDVRSLLFGSDIADVYMQPHIGGDQALLAGLARGLLEIGAVDEQFLSEHTDDWDEFRSSVQALSWDDLERGSGVGREVMHHVARLYSSSQRTVFAWTMGITHHAHGVDNVRAIAALALMRGMVGRPGAGLLPLRGHSNVQGIGSMGVTPALKRQVQDALTDRFGVDLPTTPGLDTLSCIEHSARGVMRVAVHLGGNLYGSCPDSRLAGDALGKVGTTIFLSTTLNTGHVHGRGRESLILPVLARDEEPESTTQESMFNYVRLSEGGAPRHEGLRSEVAVIASIAREVLGPDAPLDFATMERHDSIREAIAAVIPGYSDIAEIGSSRREFQIDGRTFHEPRFATPTGRAKFFALTLPPQPEEQAGWVRLMTVRSEGQFNTVVYEEEDLYRGQERRDVIMMNRRDIARFGLRVDDRVDVVSDTGRMDGVLVRELDIRSGNAAMYYPEANILVPRVADAESRTPAFKNIRVQVMRSRRLDVVASSG